MKLPLTSSDNNAQLASLQRPYSTAQGNTVSTGSTVIATGGNIKSGQAAYDSGTGFWLGNDAGVPKFSIGDSAGDKMTWDGSALSVTGNLTATTGTIGGWTIGATTITGGSVTLDSDGNIRAGQTAYNTGTGFWLGVDGATPKFSIGTSATSSFLWDGTTILLAGNIKYTNDNTRIIANSSDGSDDYVFMIGGGGAISSARGAHIQLSGNEAGGSLFLNAGSGIVEILANGGSDGLTVSAAGVVSASLGMVPEANDGAYLGTSALGWSDLFLAEGGVINWDNGDATLTQAGNVVTLAGATLTADVNGTIGATTPAAGSFTTATASGLVDISGAAAGQIKFPASQNASANANTLDDYEEGAHTFTLHDAASGGNASATTVAGRYTKIGRLVVCSFATLNNIDTTGMTGANDLFISLPFAAGFSGDCGVCVLDSFAFGAGRAQVTPVTTAASDRASFRATGTGVADTVLTVGAITTGASDIFAFSLTYQT
jgi:hypothetical protein